MELTMTQDLLTKATALLEARKKATRWPIRCHDDAGKVVTDPNIFNADFLDMDDAEFYVLAANTAAEIITGYQQLLKEKDGIIQTLEDENEMLTESNEHLVKCEAERNDLRRLVRRMADALELAGQVLEDCMVSHAPGQDFAETVQISSKRQHIIASRESISKILAEVRASLPPESQTPTHP
jgi:hypothetical protein